MGKGLKTNLILAGVLIFIGAFAYWYDLKSKPQRDSAEVNRKKLYPIDDLREVEKIVVHYKDAKDSARPAGKMPAAKITAVTIACRQNCTLTDANARWEITDPIQFNADAGNVGSFITSVAAAVVNETIPVEGVPEDFLKKFGLDADKRKDRMASIKFRDAKVPLNIFFGDDNSMEDNVYVLLEGPEATANKIRMIPAHVKNNLTRHLSYWRSKKLFDFAASQVEKIKLVNNHGSVTLEKKKGDWFLPGGAADNELIDTFLTGLVFTNATEFVSDDKLKDRSKLKIGNKPKYSVTVTVAVAAAKERLKEKPGKPSIVTLDIYEGQKTGADTKSAKIYGLISNRNIIVELDRVATEKYGKKPAEFKKKLK